MRIAALSQGKSLGRTVEGNLTFMTRALIGALEHAPDIVCLPEAFTAKGVQIRSVADVAETVPGRTTDIFADLAIKHRCYIVCPIYTVRDGIFRNSAVLIDKAGAIVGIYDKVRPSASSADYSVFEEGIIPGVSPGYFDLSFGRIAIRICMDVEFPGNWKDLEDNDVKVVFWPSAFDGGIMLQAHAIQHHYYIVSAVRAGRARVIDPCGHVVAETTPDDSYVVADVNLDFAVMHYGLDPSVFERIKTRYGGRVLIKHYREEGLFVIEPAVDDLTTAEVCSELGLDVARHVRERHADAHQRSIAATVLPC